MAFVVFLLVVAMAGGGWLMWCWHEELEARLPSQHQRVRLAEQELAGLRRALRVELAGQWARQRLLRSLKGDVSRACGSWVGRR
jgi:hypothetical protein